MASAPWLHKAEKAVIPGFGIAKDPGSIKRFITLKRCMDPGYFVFDSFRDDKVCATNSSHGANAPRHDSATIKLPPHIKFFLFFHILVVF